jgi:ectoine hydroxylase-related dioxygenase (phytanoyl-CoA dioxygenase family)
MSLRLSPAPSGTGFVQRATLPPRSMVLLITRTRRPLRPDIGFYVSRYCRAVLSAVRFVGAQFGAGLKPHSDEVLLTAEAGSLIVFNRHLWHSGTFNYSPHPRIVITASFVRSYRRGS